MKQEVAPESNMALPLNALGRKLDFLSGEDGIGVALKSI